VRLAFSLAAQTFSTLHLKLWHSTVYNYCTAARISYPEANFVKPYSRLFSGTIFHIKKSPEEKQEARRKTGDQNLNP